MELQNLSPAEGSTHVGKRKGRGHGSGNGKTAGRGHKGQWARSGGGVRIGFEGGQMPLARRVPKRGFNNIFAKPLTAVNLRDLGKYAEGETVSKETLLEKGVITKCQYGVKILGEGELSMKLNFSVNAVSASAKEKIEKAGGKVEVL
jgi:ribosomal protein L15, bacterial/organelle